MEEYVILVIVKTDDPEKARAHIEECVHSKDHDEVDIEDVILEE